MNMRSLSFSSLNSDMSRKTVELLSVSTHIIGQPVLNQKCLTSDEKALENSIRFLRELVLAWNLNIDPWGRGECWSLGHFFSSELF